MRRTSVCEYRPAPPFDIQIPQLGLPALAGTTLGSIPSAIPYLTPDAERSQRWQHELQHASAASNGSVPKLNIGIVWRGSLRKKGDQRSLPLRHFAALAALDGVRLISLQLRPGQELADAGFPVVDWGSRFDEASLEDLAAALVNVDLVITVDTAAAHLAGALGRPVWTVLQFVPDWRWLLDRSDSPWYPTMRLFRQKQYGNWGEVFERVTAEARGLVERGRGSQRVK